jgi:hypothetical protein
MNTTTKTVINNYINKSLSKGNNPYNCLCIQYIGRTNTKEKIDEFHKRKWVDTEIVPCDPLIIKELIKELT